MSRITDPLSKSIMNSEFPIRIQIWVATNGTLWGERVIESYLDSCFSHLMPLERGNVWQVTGTHSILSSFKPSRRKDRQSAET